MEIVRGTTMQLGMLVVVVATAVLLFYAGTGVALVAAWYDHPYAGHGPFAPVFSAAILWFDRDRLRAAAGRGHVSGVLAIGVGLGLLALGVVSQFLLVQTLALTITIAAGTACMWGWRLVRAMAFPLGLLTTMAPPPEAVIAFLSLKLQLFAADVAATALRLVDVPVFRIGINVELSGGVVEVSEGCNGLRFLLALLVFTAACAYMTQRTMARAAVLIAAAVPVAIAANALRVTIIAVAVHYLGLEGASGIAHHWFGKVTWSLALLPLLVFGFWLRRERTIRRSITPRAEARSRHVFAATDRSRSSLGCPDSERC
jgi:exosortase